MPIAIVFPGQGSQQPGFALPWLDHPASIVLDLVEAHSPTPLRRLVTDERADLTSTHDAQLSVLTNSLLVWQAVRTRLGTLGLEPIAFAGHSLGQITALIGSQALSLHDGLTLARARAEASAAAQERDPGALIALLGADEEQATALCRTLADRAWIANVNGAGQVIVGTRIDDVDAVLEAAPDAGIRRTRRLAVDGAFHTPLMRHAAARLLPISRDVPFAAPDAPIVTNHDARPVTDADGWPERLDRHLVEPVRWDAVVERLVELGADHIVEIGPGRTLSGLIRRIAPDVGVVDVQTPDDLERLDTLAHDLAVGVPS